MKTIRTDKKFLGVSRHAEIDKLLQTMGPLALTLHITCREEVTSSQRLGQAGTGWIDSNNYHREVTSTLGPPFHLLTTPLIQHHYLFLFCWLLHLSKSLTHCTMLPWLLFVLSPDWGKQKRSKMKRSNEVRREPKVGELIYCKLTTTVVFNLIKTVNNIT